MAELPVRLTVSPTRFHFANVIPPGDFMSVTQLHRLPNGPSQLGY